MNSTTINRAMLAVLVACMGTACSQDQANALAAEAADASSTNGMAAARSRAPGASSLPTTGRTPMQGFASAPDRGDLVAYPDRQVIRRAGPYTWHRADVSEAHALRAIIDGVLTITAPSGERLRFQYDRHVEHDTGDWTWIGHVIGGGAAQDAILTFGAGAVFGSIAQPGKAPLDLTVDDGASWLVETDSGALNRQSQASGRYDRPDFLVPPELPVVDGLRAQASAPRAAGASASATTVVDVLVGYTDGFAAEWTTNLGNRTPIMTRLNFLVDVTNESYVNSQVDAEVRMVHSMQVAYTDASDNSEALAALTGSDGSTTPSLSAVDPALQPLHAARDQYGADLVSLVRDFNHPEAVSCGVAWLLGGGQAFLHSGYEVYGMSIVSDGSDGGYRCEDQTFAHELGHNMGLAHDVETAKGEDGVLDDDDYGRYPYSFGYRTDAAHGDFYTVMAYSDTQVNGYRVFSNPGITICGGFACGVADQADNARSLRQTIPVITTFRAQVVPGEPTPTARVDRDINGDGRADVHWFNDATGRYQPWYMDGGSWSYGQAYDLGTTKYKVAGSGDFNGDGRADLLWQDHAETEVWIWQARADGSNDIVFLRNFPTGWKIAGIADFNGDGRDDVFWYNSAIGRTQAWYMNGSSWTYGPVSEIVPDRFSVAGVGDFNGDQLADVVWHDNAKTQVWAWLAQPQGNFTIHYLRDYPAGWSIVGTGDADADGRKDIVWHNPTVGSLQTWFMNGATWIYGEAHGIASQYKVAAIDDFDGDGRVDIFWHDDAHAWLWIAQPQGGYSIAYLRTYPTGWKVVNDPS